MPCLIITGYPSAGKSTLAQHLQTRALRHSAIDDVVIVNEATACPDLTTPQERYGTSLNEKQTRAALKSAFDRAIASGNERTLVILDSLNYIKGVRYELHCISKAAGEKHGILWVLNRGSVVQEWNEKRAKSTTTFKDAYPPSLLQELILRYEPPDERNRWDKPLFSIDVAPPEVANSAGVAAESEAVQKSVYNMHALGDTLGVTTDVSKSDSTTAATKKKPTKSAFSRAKRKPTNKPSSAAPKPMYTPDDIHASNNKASESSTDAMAQNTSTTHLPSNPEGTKVEPSKKPLDEQLDEILDAFLLRTNALKEGSSTRQRLAGNANVLQQLDSTTQRLIGSIASASAQTVHTGGLLQVTTSSVTVSINCPRPVALPELRRLRKQYLQWVATYPPEDCTEKGIAKSFVKYVEAQL